MTMNTHREGNLTKVIESQTSKVPSGVFLTVALTVMAASLTLKCLGRKHKHTSLFVGQWAAPLLIMGLYNKLVKTEGHD